MDKQKYEREIEEILEKYEKDSGRKSKVEKADSQVGGIRPGPGAPVRKAPVVPGGWNWRRVSSGQYMAAAFAAALLAVLVRGLFPPLATLLVIAAVVLFLLPIFLYRSTGTSSGGWSSNEQKRWRGQVIDFSTRRNITNDPLENIRRWLRRR